MNGNLRTALFKKKGNSSHTQGDFIKKDLTLIGGCFGSLTIEVALPAFLPLSVLCVSKILTPFF